MKEDFNSNLSPETRDKCKQVANLVVDKLVLDGIYEIVLVFFMRKMSRKNW